jgi:hypothetical protein
VKNTQKPIAQKVAIDVQNSRDGGIKDSSEMIKALIKSMHNTLESLNTENLFNM